jgi:hypothetical protein
MERARPAQFRGRTEEVKPGSAWVQSFPAMQVDKWGLEGARLLGPLIVVGIAQES